MARGHGLYSRLHVRLNIRSVRNFFGPAFTLSDFLNHKRMRIRAYFTSRERVVYLEP